MDEVLKLVQGRITTKKEDLDFLEENTDWGHAVRQKIKQTISSELHFLNELIEKLKKV